MNMKTVSGMLLIVVAGTILFWPSTSGSPDVDHEGEEVLSPLQGEGPALKSARGFSPSERTSLSRQTEEEHARSTRLIGSNLVESGDAVPIIVFGTIRSRRGTPIARATVRLETYPEPRMVTSDARGQYQIEGEWRWDTRLPRVTAFRQGYMSTSLGFPFMPLAGTKRKFEKNFILDPGSSITGRVLFGKRPVPGARILLVPDSSLRISGRPGQSLSWTSGSGIFYCKVDPAVSYTLFVNSGRYGNATLHHHSSNSPSIVDLGDIHLSSVHVIRGRICYPNREGIGGLTVRAKRIGKGILDADLQGANFGRTRTGPNGFFTLAGMASGSFLITFPATMSDRLFESNFTVSSDQPLRTIIVPAHRILIALADEKRKALSPRRATIHYREKVARGKQRSCRRNSPMTNQEENHDRLVSPGSIWEVDVSWMEKSSKTTVHTKRAGNETRVRLVLKSKG